MMKRYLLLIAILVIVLTGCDTNYTLTINNDTIDEEINVVLPENYLPEQTAEEKAAHIETDDQITPYLTDDQYPIMYDKKNKYTRSSKKEHGMLNVTYNYTYSYDDYKRSQIYNKCFEEKYFSSGKDTTFIAFKGRFSCMTGSEVVFNIKTNKTVIDNNADRVKGNTYTWIIDKNNAKNVNIEMTISNKNKFVMPIMIIVIITSIVVIFGMLGYAFYKLKNRALVNDI